MKKNLKLIVFTVVLCAVSALNVKVVLDTEHSSDLAMTSLAAIGEGGSGEGTSEGNSGEGGGQESNNQGSGKFFYQHLLGRPSSCTLYRYIGAGVSFTSTDESLAANGQYTKISIHGVEEGCPKSGSGCTVYSCQQTD